MPMPVYVRKALDIALAIDSRAESMGEGAWDCLLISIEHAPAVIDALGDRFDFEDPNDPPLAHTRVLVQPILEDVPAEWRDYARQYNRVEAIARANAWTAS